MICDKKMVLFVLHAGVGEIIIAPQSRPRGDVHQAGLDPIQTLMTHWAFGVPAPVTLTMEVL